VCLNRDLNLDNFIKTIELKYVNPGIVEGSNLVKGWLPGNNEYEANLEITQDPERSARSKLLTGTWVEAIHIMTKALVDNDVGILVGTDANVTGTVPGFSLHDEMVSLSNVGLSNERILKAATIDAANFMKRKTGKIEIGYKSDLLLLSKKPS